MNIYHYDPETGEFTRTGTARNDPRDPARVLVPRYATTEPPPVVRGDQAAVFAAGAWRPVADFRARVYFRREDGMAVTFGLGETPGRDVVASPAPPAGRMVFWDGAQWSPTEAQARADARAAVVAAGFQPAGQSFRLALEDHDRLLLAQYQQVLAGAVAAGRKRPGDAARLKDMTGAVHELTVAQVLAALEDYGLYVMELYWTQQGAGGET